MIIPRHVLNIAFEIQKELEKQMRNGDNEKETIRCLNKIQEINNQLKQNSRQVNCYLEMMELMNDILDTSSALCESATTRIFKEVYIEPELVYAINHTRIMHPKIARELDMVSDFLSEVPAQGWKENDKLARFNEFKMIKTKSHWENLMNKHYGSDLSVDRFDNSLRLNHIKIGYVITPASVQYMNGTVAKAKNFLTITLGEDRFRKYKKAFDIWFRVGNIKTYYIYIPK